KLIVRFAQREVGRKLSAEEAQTVQRRHSELFRQIVSRPRPLPGAVEAFQTLGAARVPHAIATASHRPIIDASLEALGVGPKTVVVEGKGEFQGKPEPDLFLESMKLLAFLR